MMRPLTILYVDDEPDIRTVAMLALELDGGFTVWAAESRTQALALLDAAPGRPDAALLDVMMPDGTGADLMDAIHRRPGLETLPVIFLTARAGVQDVAGYRDRGAIGVVVKPFDPMTLAREVRALLGPRA